METSEKKLVFEIKRRLIDKRFDAAAFDLLQDKFPENDLSRGMITRLIDAGRVTLNGRAARSSRLVDLHDTVEVFETDLAIPAPELDAGREIAIPIVYEDEQLVAINKPAGIQAHPAGRTDRATVAHWIVNRYPALRVIGEDALRPGIVHRLDRETSGALLIAKTTPAFEELKQLFQNRAIAKTYIALVYGHMPEREGIVERPLMQRPGELKRFVVETQNIPEAARPAITAYRVIARYRDFDLLAVTPKTGRTHQIRVHLAFLGCPVVGDKLYAFKPARRGEKLFSARQLLHAYRLTFDLFEKKYAIEAPLPDDFRTLLLDIDETKEAGYDDEALKSLLTE
ncbi:MAG: hypothetical protein A3E38_00610 [Candidatus Moranbacteria bacterium RIFCSPHIGHO2_12_FULL_54_9]|nr:MAG: hypothetical protein A2878_00840 [Candidatus Moranbacteria bacterium RIFCSPHIGHO2_01_FULL_54_31]OGI24742.1 MAG: hypothetical protein A3E38_00610 [Candidatus Moranbacteria bacterium RIFCSPHIGHO2_12_FULL_54_9]